MDLPDVRAGMAIMADHIQRINAAIRQARIRPGIGYHVRESSGGTSLIINPGMISGAGGGGGIPCPFECSDASVGTALKVQVAWGLIWQRLPTGMFPNNTPPLKLTVTESCFIYSKIVFDTDTLLPNSISFEVETELKENTNTTQYNLIASVFVDEQSDPPLISAIRNVCEQPFPSPCSLD
jgi:hypothetical protein